MLKTIRKVSLRTRLALLAAFAIVALVVALFVAWRLARATETFALRQADSAVHNAARDLSRELQAHPSGYQTIEEALPNGPDKQSSLDSGPLVRPDRQSSLDSEPGRQPDKQSRLDSGLVRQRGPHDQDRNEEGRPHRVPPHIETLFAAYSDPLARLTAITLHRFPGVEGGFYRPADGVLIGYASAQGRTAISTGKVSGDLNDLIRTLASQAITNGAPVARTSEVGSERILLVVYPAAADGLPASWAMQRLSPMAGVADWPNLTALVVLGLSIIAVSGIALLTVRDLRSGVTGIEAGLAGLTTDLNRQVSLPDTAELARIATAINDLAATLRTNLARQAELEQELAHRERLSALGRVVAGVAHEVRNPLAAIKLKVQLARRASYAPDKLAGTFDVVTAEIDRLDTLVHRLLEFGGQRTLERSAVDLSELITSRAAFFHDVAARAGVAIVANAFTENIVVAGDGNRLAQVVDNIIQNALDAMPDGGRLTITGETVQGEYGSRSARLRFEDTGQGIERADQEHIFEPFHTNRDTGTGLGLAIARAIVEEHGGRLSFVTGNGNGAVFVVELPLQPVTGQEMQFMKL